MARNDPDFEVESTVDLDNIDTAAAEKLLARASGDDDIDIETIADPRISPEDARAKPLPADSNADPTEEELQAYSEQVQKRIKTLSHARHDERREKEAAQRERDDAVAYARQMHARATALESQSENLTNNALSGAIEKISGQLEAARKE